MQKLIILYGLYNSGKTLLYNLFRKEDKFICLDISPDHFDIYKEKMIKQIGKKNTNDLKPLIKSTEIFNTYVFLEKFGLIMKEYSNYNFVIKPGNYLWAYSIYHKRDSVLLNLKKYTSIKSVDDIYPLFVVRHPKISWVTASYKTTTIDEYINFWNYNKGTYDLKIYDIVKIEDIVNNQSIKSLIKKTNLNEILPYSKFDLQVKLKNDYSRLKEDFKRIDKELENLMICLNYDKDDKNVELFFNDNLTLEESKINWRII